ncbi:MAG: TolC family protein [Bacteroidia bacterium]|nr:TolC family protein [Bacteroidia bacterium]
MTIRSIISLLVFSLIVSVSMAQDANTWDLRKCLEYALESNISLKQAELNRLNNQIGLEQAEASRMPSLSFGGNTTTNFGYSVNPFTNQFTSQAIQSLNAGLSSNVTVFNGFRISNTIKQAELDLKASELDLKQAENDLALNITIAYLQILRNEEIVKSAEFQVASTKEQRDRTEKLVRAGSLAQADLIQLESQIATDELTLVNAQNQRELSYLNLMQLLRLDPNQPFRIQVPELNEPGADFMDASTAEIYKLAESTQPFIQSADINVQSSALDMEIAKAGRLPSLTASGQIGSGYSSGRQQFTGETFDVTSPVQISVNGGEIQPANITYPDQGRVTDTYSFGNQMVDNLGGNISLNLNIPIYSRKQNIANMQRAEVGFKNAQFTAELQRQQLEQTIQQAYLDAKSAYSSFLATQKQVAALELTFQNTEKQFNLGVANSTEYLLSKNNLNRATNDLVRTKFDFIFRTKVLDFYQGKPLGF